jgi:protein-tyrosine phosphatase
MTDAPLPSAHRRPGPYRVGIVCLGNICRSQVAEAVLTRQLADADLEHAVVVDSCGVGGWHVGHAMDERAAASLTRAGYDASRHRARQIDRGWTDPATGHDLLLAMDAGHRRALLAAGADPDRVRMFRAVDPVDPGADVPDPYYGGPDGFEEVLAMVERTGAVLVARLAQLLASEHPEARQR